MNIPEPIEAALARLAAALDLLDGASRMRSDEESFRARLEGDLSSLHDDRSRLSVELEAALARSRKLETASEEVAARLKTAGASIKAILSGAGAHES
jgi:hypothetical protein